MVHDRVQLLGELLVDRCDGAVEGLRQAALERYRAAERLFDQGLDKILGAVGLGLPGSGNDLFEKVRRFGYCRAGFGSDPGFGNGSALLFEPELPGEGLQLVLVF
jgi:hypothetical protein